MGISPRQFEQMKERVNGKTRHIPSAAGASTTLMPRRHNVILGVDPSLRGTGFGVIRLAAPFPAVLAQGTISCPRHWARSRCLAAIFRDLTTAMERYRPTVCAMEGLFFAQNLKTAIVMGEARGAALASVAGFGVEVFEIAPRRLKQAMVGYGAAQKTAVGAMVQRMLNLPEPPAPDAADALALALAYAHEAAGRFGPPGKI
ncbi:MAG: crossover junction endodeoxyribonuclease RuvC [Verrucomicrobiota bacterium]|nr:crossover junction endodeoxyribonuclease RuvC [Verrucomicrobiota bacterium]